jgi:hypothetical protein
MGIYVASSWTGPVADMLVIALGGVVRVTDGQGQGNDICKAGE